MFLVRFLGLCPWNKFPAEPIHTSLGGGTKVNRLNSSMLTELDNYFKPFNQLLELYLQQTFGYVK